MSSDVLQPLLNSMKKQKASEEEIRHVTQAFAEMNLQDRPLKELILAAAHRLNLYGELVISDHEERILRQAYALFAKEEDMCPLNVDLPLFLNHAIAHYKAATMSDQKAPSAKISDLALQIKETRELLAAIDKQKAALIEKREALEEQASVIMRLQGVNAVRTEHGTLAIQNQTISTVDDWESFAEYIYDNNAFHLIERRPSQQACRELTSSGVKIPGLKPFVRTKLSFRRN